MREALDAHGGLLVEHEGQPVGALLLEPRGRLLGLRRVGVLASVRGLGVAAKMASRAEQIATARHFGGIELEARVELPKTVAFWSKQGYVESGRNGNRLNMLKMLPDHAGAGDRRGHPGVRRAGWPPCSAAATW